MARRRGYYTEGSTARQIEYDWFEDIYNVVLNCGNFRPKEGFDTIQYQSLKDRYRIKKKQVELEKYPSGILDIFMKKTNIMTVCLYPSET